MQEMHMKALKRCSALWNKSRKDAKLFSFFDFGESAAEKSVEETPVRVELSHYINDLDESVKSLNRYPTIKSAFFLYNTPLPSSAPVERLFSYAGMGTGCRLALHQSAESVLVPIIRFCISTLLQKCHRQQRILLM
ncbi:hypothetical protein ACLKA6_013863 [Drosophila palustris]